MGVIVLEDWQEKGALKYRLVVDKDIIKTIATIDDNEITEIRKTLGIDVITINDIHKAVKEKRITIQPKTEADVYNILKKRGYNNKHIAKIMSYLRSEKII